MNFLRLSEYPFHGAGALSANPGSWDDQQVMAATVLRFTPPSGPYAGRDMYFLYYRGVDALLQGKGQVAIGVMVAEVAGFTGSNWDRVRALNPIIPPDFVAEAPVRGGDYNDMAAVPHQGQVRLYVNIYGNPKGTNRMVRFDLADGITPTYGGEVEWQGRPFGRTGGLLVNVDEVLWMLVNQEMPDGGANRSLRFSTDGRIWQDGGPALQVSGDPDAWDGHSLVVGRGFTHGDHVYAVQPGMPRIGREKDGSPHDDWPEAIGLWRCHKADLGNGRLWQKYHRNPVMLRGPTEGGCWQLGPLIPDDPGRPVVGPYQTWAMPGWGNIGSAEMNQLRMQPYAGLRAGWSTKHQYMAVAANRLALDDWQADPIPVGHSYMIRHAQSGRWLKRDGAFLVLAEAGAPGAAAARFHLERRRDFFVIRARGPQGAELGIPGPERLRRARFDQSADSPITDAPRDWLLEIVDMGADMGAEYPVALITNRHSSLSLMPGRQQDNSGDTYMVQDPALAGDVEKLFEFVRLAPG